MDKFPFTIEELESVLSQLKRNKTPGDDGIPGELYKWLDNQNRTLLLKAANDCLEVSHIDRKFLNAVVVSIIKKGIPLLWLIIDPFRCFPAVIRLSLLLSRIGFWQVLIHG